MLSANSLRYGSGPQNLPDVTAAQSTSSKTEGTGSSAGQGKTRKQKKAEKREAAKRDAGIRDDLIRQLKDAQAKEREEALARNNAANLERPTLWKAVQNTLNKLSPLPELAGGVAIALVYHKGFFPLIRGSIPPNPEQVTYPDPTWDKFSVNQYTQCYSYALNTVEKKYLPGELAGHPFNDLTCEGMGKGSRLDGLTVPLTNAGPESICPPNHHVVAAYRDPNNGDPHYYRKNSDGTWSHKLGYSKPSNLDGAGNLIESPETANPNYRVESGFPGIHWDFTYSELCEYLCALDHRPEEKKS